MLVLFKWSATAGKATSEDEIDNKDLLPPLTEIHITKLCYITRNPGSREAGHKVSMIAKDNLKLAVYWIRHQIRVSWSWDLMDIDTDVLNVMCQKRDLEGHISEAHIPPKIDVKDWPKAFELICEHLDHHRGLKDNRLSYCVCTL